MNSHEKYVEIEKNFNSSLLYKDKLKECEQIIKLQHPNIFNLINYEGNTEE